MARDISPVDADNDDYGDLPIEERVALADDQAALQRLPSRELEPLSEPEHWWDRGEIVHLHIPTQCGRVHVPDYGDLNFDGRTRLEPGLVLKQGLELDVRLVERGRHWVQVVELAKAQVEARPSSHVDVTWSDFQPTAWIAP